MAKVLQYFASTNELELLVISSYNVLMGNVLIEVVALTITNYKPKAHS
jgi:hypothetical protein